MAGTENVGSIVYEVGMDIAPLLQGTKQAEKALDNLDAAAQGAGKGLDTLEGGAKETGSGLGDLGKQSDSAGTSLKELTGYSKSIDGSLKTLNSSVNAITRAMQEARTNTGGAGAEFSRAEAIIEGLGNQLAILEEAQQGSARSAAILAAQLRAGSAASEEEKNTIGQLAAAFFDLKTSADESAKSTAQVAAASQQAESSISRLEGDIAILNSGMQDGARAAAILAAQMSAGVGATQEQKNKIAELSGSLYDMREAQNSASRAASQAAKQLAQEASEANRVASIVSGLSEQVSVLSSQQADGARSAAILAAQLRAGDAATQSQKAKIADLVGSIYDMREAQSAATKESAEAARQLALEASEAEKVNSITEGLAQQISILSEQQTNGARSAAILAAQMRAGSAASDAEKEKIGALTGQLFDMRSATDKAMGGNRGWKGSMQQAGYQVQDFIVQVQGGQSALVAFSQQGSQLAGAFGPGGAVIGAVIALSTVVAGTLIASLNGGKSAIEALTDAASAMDKVISVSQNGIAALSDKYANLARVNAEVATLMRNQALLEYNQAIAKIPKAIGEASSAFVSFGDKALSALSGGYASVQGFNDRLASLNITTDDFSAAMKQAYSAGSAFNATTMSIGNTVGALASKLGISEQEAFNLAKQLSDLSKNPSPEALQTLALRLQGMTSSSKEGQKAITDLLGPIVDLARESANAAFNVDSLKKSTDNLTTGQKSLIQQSERNLALSKLQGEARARLQAQYAAEDAGFSKDDPHAVQMERDAAATYKNTEAQKTLTAENKKAVTQGETVAQKLEKLRQQSELAADSTKELSREQALLNAEQSLGKGATQGQIEQARQYAAAKWDTANAIRAEAAVQKLLPETKENASYKQDVEDLNTALSAKKISQEQYNSTSERLEQTHVAALAKIRADQAVSPMQEAAGRVDPVQALANQHAQQLALIQQFEQQGVITHQNALAQRNALDTVYEQQRIAAQWEIFKNQSQANQILAAGFESLAGNASNAFTGIITGSMTAEDAMNSLVSNALNSLINGFVQMGVEWIKSAVTGSAAQVAATAATTSAAVAGTATTTAASVSSAAATTVAWTPAAIVASIGSFGGAAAIGIGAVIAAMALSSSIAGKRKNGGPVSAGSMYQVGEGGMPEIYQASSGKQFMIPGDNGKVISNKDMQGSGGGGGGGVVVNINNYTSSTVDAQATPDGKGGWTVDAFVYDISNGGPASQAIEQYHQAPRKARG